MRTGKLKLAVSTVSTPEIVVKRGIEIEVEDEMLKKGRLVSSGRETGPRRVKVIWFRTCTKFGNKTVGAGRVEASLACSWAASAPAPPA